MYNVLLKEIYRLIAYLIKVCILYLEKYICPTRKILLNTFKYLAILGFARCRTSKFLFLLYYLL